MKQPPAVCLESGNTDKSHSRCESPVAIVTLSALRMRRRMFKWIVVFLSEVVLKHLYLVSVLPAANDCQLALCMEKRRSVPGRNRS